jgi:hypothetical protein
MAGLLSRRLLPFVAVLILVPAASPAPGCPFCTMQGQTLTKDVSEASMVLVGTFTDAKMGENFGEGTTDLIVEDVLKKHDILDQKVRDVNGKKVLTLSRYVPSQDKNYKFMVLCDVFKERIDPYRGVAVRADCDVAGYVRGALKVQDKDAPARLRYFFDYLDNAEVEVANDAYKEFGNAGYSDYRDMAKKLPADKIAGWLKDPSTPAFRYGLYAYLLGHCGTEEHAGLLKDMLEDPKKKLFSGTDGMLAGYTLLKPKEGWAYTRGILKDPAKEFTQRYAALRAVRFFWDSRPDVIARNDVVDAVKLLLAQDDIADLAIEDLRKWGRWECADPVLDLYGLKSHDVPIIKRSILRYALSAKGPDGAPHPRAAAFVADLRKKDPQMVADAEELLRLETPPAPTPVGSK